MDSDNNSVDNKPTEALQADDPIVRELIPGYVKNRKLEIFQLKRLLEDNAFDKIRIIGHNLKGSGGLYGLPPISTFGSQLETAALSSNNTEIADVIAALHVYLDELNL